MTNGALVSTTDLLTAAKQTLLRNGFSSVERFALSDVDATKQCLFEDAYSLVAIVAFETWADLFREWSDVQTSFVDLISEHISRDERKSWDCYLVLWTPDITPQSEIEKRQSIRYDTGRVRKLIAAGEELRELADVETALLPLLPISEQIGSTSQDSVLAKIPDIVKSGELSRGMLQAVVDAFEQQESLLDAIHKYGDTE